MTRREKLRRKLRNNPTGATMQEVETLLTHFGFALDRVSGSHHLFIYRQAGVFRSIGIPLHGRKVKNVYVQNVVELLDELFPVVDQGDEAESDD